MPWRRLMVMPAAERRIFPDNGEAKHETYHCVGVVGEVIKYHQKLDNP